jgi:hypothetical protein
MSQDQDVQAGIRAGVDCVTAILKAEGDDDGLKALGELFGFCAGAEADLVPAELLGIVGRLANEFVDSMAEVDQQRADFEARNAEDLERERARAELVASSAFTVRITRLDGQVVNVGPYTYHFQAEHAAAYFRGCAHNTAGAEKATVQVLPYDESEPHRVGDLPSGPDQLAMLMDTDDQEAGDFPDLYSRFAAFHGGEETHKIWRLACNTYDTMHTDIDA